MTIANRKLAGQESPSGTGVIGTEFDHWVPPKPELPNGPMAAVGQPARDAPQTLRRSSTAVLA